MIYKYKDYNLLAIEANNILNLPKVGAIFISFSQETKRMFYKTLLLSINPFPLH